MQIYPVMTNDCEIKVDNKNIIKYDEKEVAFYYKESVELQMLKSFQKIIEKLDSVNDNLKEMQKILNRKNWE